MSRRYESWGRFPKVNQSAEAMYWRGESLPQPPPGKTLLPYGLGRSYGDSCLNSDNVIVTTRGLNRFIRFDRENGVLRCEAGVSLAEVLELIVPHGWFLPVTPGTKFVTVGGAVANDVHGKNHHVAGTFGNWVNKFELLFSNGSRILCSPTANSDIFRATIGGLGLTGLITWVEFRLIRMESDRIAIETQPFHSLSEFLDLSTAHSRDFPYLVAWIDSLSWKNGQGRGVFMRGKHAPGGADAPKNPGRPSKFSVPFNFPSFTMSRGPVSILNRAHYLSSLVGSRSSVSHYEPFFYPLDSIGGWNRVFGKRGFVQWQGLVPFSGTRDVLPELLRNMAYSSVGSFVSVMKVMGDIPSLGKLSFSRPGVTLALDFPACDAALRLLDRLNCIVADAGGAVYPAKDARMSAQQFDRFYPQWREFECYIDPNFSSSLWRRVTALPQRKTKSSIETNAAQLLHQSVS
ncbi:MAG: FAD-binding oxidoreductase [Hyphomicrobium sp.]